MGQAKVLPVDPSNAEQFRVWDGVDGGYWAENADRFDAAVAGYQRPFLDAAGIRGRDRVLDIGCGNGETTCDAARLAQDGWALGIDLSMRMVERARLRAADRGLTNVRFEQGDAQIHPFEPASFDVAISRTGAIFFGDPAAGFRNIAGALVPGGRLVLLSWQPLERNEWLLEFGAAVSAGRDAADAIHDGPGKLALADPDAVNEILRDAGFTDVELEGRSEPLLFGSDAEDAFRFLAPQGFIRGPLEAYDEAGRGRALDALKATVVAHETSAGVYFGSAAWIITATRR